MSGNIILLLQTVYGFPNSLRVKSNVLKMSCKPPHNLVSVTSLTSTTLFHAYSSPTQKASLLFFACAKLALPPCLCTYSLLCLNTLPQMSLYLSFSPPPNLCTDVTFSVRPVLTEDNLFFPTYFILLNFFYSTHYLTCYNIIYSLSLSTRMSTPQGQRSLLRDIFPRARILSGSQIIVEGVNKNIKY